jgi:tRNA(fMet)-specific endonuclease VapC
MKIVLDTNRYTDFQKGDPNVQKVLQAAEAVLLPFAVIAELRTGFMGGSRGQRNEQIFVQFLQRAGVSSLYPDERTTRAYAEVFQQLRRQGTPIPSNDMGIAALTLQHGLTLYSRDAHFDHLPQIPRV